MVGGFCLCLILTWPAGGDMHVQEFISKFVDSVLAGNTSLLYQIHTTSSKCLNMVLLKLLASLLGVTNQVFTLAHAWCIYLGCQNR